MRECVPNLFNMPPALLHALAAAFLPLCCVCSATKGCISLDEWTFDKVVGRRGEPILVKFDSSYSYGAAQDAWTSAAAAVGEARSVPILMAEVGISQWGDDGNTKLAERYGIEVPADFPAFRLFQTSHSEKTHVFPFVGNITEVNILTFINQNTPDDVWIGLPGTLRDYDNAVPKFVAAAKGTVPALNEVLVDLSGGTEVMNDDDRVSATFYIKVMKALLTTSVGSAPEYLAKERSRINRMVSSQAVAASKKRLFQRKLNILSSFDAAAAAAAM